MGIVKDEKGHRYGRLLVLEQAEKPNSNASGAYWLCQCDCGNKKIIQGTALRTGHTISCGCYNLERNRMTKRKDIKGQRFGKLVALYPTEKTQNRHTIWKCQCDCGNLCEVSLNNLQTKTTNSCGCLKKSIGELNIEQILKENNIKFEKQKVFLKFNSKRYFDFYLPDYNRVIEFDGIQHYKSLNGIWDKALPLEERQQRDKEKTAFILNSNIDLVRIPYWKRDTMSIKDLLGDKYLIKEFADD